MAGIFSLRMKKRINNNKLEDFGMKRSAIAVSLIFFAVLLPLVCFVHLDHHLLLINDVAYRIERSLKTIDADLSRTALTIGKDIREPMGKRQALHGSLLPGRSMPWTAYS